MALLMLIAVGALALATLVAVVLLALRTARGHEHALPEWWIGLFLRAALIGGVGAVAALLLFEYGQWKVRDAYFEQAVQQGVVTREERRNDHTVYYFDPAQSGGWGRLNRYDFRVIWELVAACGAVAAVTAGVLALVVARVSIRTRTARAAFPVVLPGEPAVTRSGELEERHAAVAPGPALDPAPDVIVSDREPASPSRLRCADSS